MSRLVLDTDRVVEEARAVGFQEAGVVARAESEHVGHLERWLAADLHGEMGYLATFSAVERRADLRRTFPDFASAVVVAHSYADDEPSSSPDDPSRAVVARYARGRDYHGVVAEGLEDLARRLQTLAGRPLRHLGYADTGPLMERELAMRAGIGWFGKNTLLIDPRRGSYFFLGVLLTDLELEPSAPFEREHCGSCRSCLDACPTGALLGRDERGAPVMDASRCISYLTIELRGPIPEVLRPAIGNRVLGCDICQEVCPWNHRFSAPTDETEYMSTPGGPNGRSLLALAAELLDISGKAFPATVPGLAALAAAAKRHAPQCLRSAGQLGVRRGTSAPGAGRKGPFAPCARARRVGACPASSPWIISREHRERRSAPLESRAAPGNTSPDRVYR